MPSNLSDTTLSSVSLDWVFFALICILYCVCMFYAMIKRCD